MPEEGFCFETINFLDSRRHGRRRSGNRQRMLRRWGRDGAGAPALDRRHAFASSVAIIFPLCALSAIIYYTRGHLDLMGALPYLVGGLIGGLIGGKIFEKIPVVWLKRAFALLILYGAWSALRG